MNGLQPFSARNASVAWAEARGDGRVLPSLRGCCADIRDFGLLVVLVNLAELRNHGKGPWRLVGRFEELL